MAHLGQRVANAIGALDGTSYLVRTQKVEKLAHGGPRGIDIHLNSITVECPRNLSGRRLMILDDVMTTGNSLVACRQLLLDAGADEVICAAMSQTTY
jgi:predicted amidophosphoribosyltransferase